MISQKVLIFICFCILSEAKDDLLVTLPVGKVQGSAKSTVNKVPYYSFQGIPYGEAPVGELRFLAPKAKAPWTGILDGTKQKQSCFQLLHTADDSSEDCLLLNVFTPRTPSNNHTNDLPILFFIHDGGFQEGYPDEVNYGPQHLMERDIILVTCNYRMGPWGFLSTGDLVIPGNAGLKDQTLALKWVQQYISYFGGDPAKVTIYGLSAGAASVGLHILSPVSAGLFRAGFSQSSAALGPGHYQSRQEMVTFKLAEYVDSENPQSFNDSKALLKYLQNQPPETIQHAAFALMNDTYKIFYRGYSTGQQGYLFAAVTEVEHEGAFLVDSPYQLLKSGKFNRVPYLVGFTASELLEDLDNEETAEETAKNYDANPEILIPDDMNVTDYNRWMTAELIREFYVNGTTFSDNLRKIVDYGSDQEYVRSIIKHAVLHSSHAHVYLYNFRYLGPMGGHSEVSVEGFSDDTWHGEDLSYVLARNYKSLNTTDLTKYSEMDRNVFQKFIYHVASFVKTLNPTPVEKNWKPFGDAANYLDVGSTFVYREKPRWDMVTFWDNLYNKYGRKPFITY